MHIRTKPKVVIVEDDLPIQQMYELKLRLGGYDVICANDGVEGLVAIKSFQPDIILLDIRMPQLSGDKMLEKLRSHKWGADIRVIILTNISKDEAPMSLRLLNVDRFIVKAHHTPNQVLSIINELIGNPLIKS